MVSLGFFSLYIKAYMSWGKNDISYVGVMGMFLCLGFFFDTLENFVVFFAGILVCLYTITLYKIWCYLRILR